MDDKILKELEKRLKKLQAQEACRNLVGRYLFAHPAFDNIPFVESWAKREDDALEMPWGTYKGYEGVRNCYLRDHGDRTYQETYDTLGGALFLHEADTEVLEVADDCRTARGVWISMGHETFVMNEKSRNTGDPEGTWEAEWAWSKYAFDFIEEDGEWKIWHMRLYPLFKAPFGKSWVEEKQPEPEDWNFEDIDSRPEVPWWTYGPDKIYPADEPEPPLPYHTYSDLRKEEEHE